MERAGDSADSQGDARKSPMRRLIYPLMLITVAGATIVVLLLMQNIFRRQREAEQIVFSLVDLDERTIDPQAWGRNFPRQYDGYRRTVDIERTRFGGSEAVQKLDETPRWRTIFAGYAFAIDYREERGHAFMLSDQRETERVRQRPQPGACLHCHASVTGAYREAGIAAGAPGSATDALLSDTGRQQLQRGFEAVCRLPYAEATTMVQHPVSCIDCHDPGTMHLRVTRPAFMTGIAALAASDDAVPHIASIERWRRGDRAAPYDPNLLATRQEMRSFVCGQCHVEYYFRGEERLLTYPWHNGLKVQQVERYYDEAGFRDWTHARSGAGVLKAQHPEFELWSQGIHARSGVSCADCHMPYMRQGAVKISDHHVRSPLLNINHACQTCHRYPETELLARAETIQSRTRQLMERAESALVELIEAIEAAAKAGAGEEPLAAARDLQRRAQWRLDFVAAENSMGFHADQESARILGEAIDFARQGQLRLPRS
jgi:nitrite reductase (cytochrome c-552)